jgi:excisionase family DNA binding protein
MGTHEDNCLTAAELAKRLRVKPSTVLDWQRTGRIPAIRITNKVLRFNLAEVMSALRRATSDEGVDR